MTDKPETNRAGVASFHKDAAMTAADPRAWFIREVLPLEALLMQFLRRNRNNADDIVDLRQDIYVRVFEAAQKQIPDAAKPFLFTTARNLIINRVRHEQVVAIEAVADLDELNIASTEPEPERTVMARDVLRLLQEAIDKLPPRPREAILLNKVEGLSRREIAQRMGIAEDTVRQHLMHAMRGLTDVLYSEQSDLRRRA